MAKKEAEQDEQAEYKMNVHGNIYSNVTLETPKGRAMWLNLRQVNKKSAKYSLTLLFPKDSSLDKNTVAKLKAIKAVGLELLKVAGKKGIGHKFPPILDGDKREDEHEDLAGCWYIGISSKDPIELVDIDREDLEPTDFSAGMICKASLQPSFFTGFGAGIAYQAKALMLVKDDGVRLKSAVSGVSAFSDELEDEDEDLDETPKKKVVEKKAKAVELDEDEDEDYVAPKKKVAKKAKAVELDEDEDEDEDDLDDKPKKSAKKKAVELDEDEDEDEDEDYVAPKKKKSSGASLTDVL